jgi:hypothetical protein
MRSSISKRDNRPRLPQFLATCRIRWETGSLVSRVLELGPGMARNRVLSRLGTRPNRMTCAFKGAGTTIGSAIGAER